MKTGMSMQNNLVTVKVGSHVITREDGLPNEEVIASISSQISLLKKKGYQVVLVSSGAVAAGRSIFRFNKTSDTIELRQVLSSIGQVELISMYKKVFDSLGVLCAQVLVTKEDFKSRTHYLNMKNCVSALLKNDIVPIINENDVVSVTELMFTDNDELAGLVSAMINTSRLVILTSVDGIFDSDPSEPGSSLIRVYDKKRFEVDRISAGKKSSFGRGGILTKCHTAEKIAGMGIPVQIANGRTENILLKIIENKDSPGTLFPARKMLSSIKKYIAHAYDVVGKVMINDGAKAALTHHAANSLLPIGVVKVIGKFKRGDVIRIVDESGHEIGLGQARFNAMKIQEIMGQKNQKPLIHYDHLYLH
jgi:glutamate 5-kinase